MKLFTPEWIEALREHIELNVKKYSTQQKYADVLGIDAGTLSRIVNDKLEGKVSRKQLLSIAEKSGFDLTNTRKLAVEPYPETKETEPIDYTMSHDITAINNYIHEREVLINLNQDYKNRMLNQRLGIFKDELEKIQF